MAQRPDAAGFGGRYHRGGYDPSLRIGDAERNEVIDALGQHYSAGRLDEAELKERLDRAAAAKTGGDLAGILTDLPPLASPGSPPGSPPVPARPRRAALWVAVVVVLFASAVPWQLGPWGWQFLHPPVLLVAVVVLLVWRRSRRRRRQSVSRY